MEAHMSKWDVLSERMRRTNVFMGSRIASASLQGAAEAGRAVWHEEVPGGAIIGYAGIWDTPDPEWLELGAIWVAEEHRRKGLGSDLYERRLAILPSGYNICVLTGSEEAAHLALRNGFAEVLTADWFLTVPSSVSCIPCDKAGKEPGTERPDCPLRGNPGQCRMFVRLRTS